jgi:oxygen-dependent protoporphyrinogen oxidase
MRKFRIIGGGFSGLTLAWRLVKAGHAVEIFEMSHRWGGLIGTELNAWGMSEQAANALLNSSRVEELAKDIGVELLPSGNLSKKRYILKNGQIRKWPLSFLGTLRFIFGVFKYIFNKDKCQPKTHDGLDKFVSSIFGAEFFTYFISPALRGIFATDEVSPLLLARSMQTKAHKSHSGIKGSVSPRNGMIDLIYRLVVYLEKAGVVMHLNSTGEIDPRYTNIVCTDAHSASVLLAPFHLESAKTLAAVKYKSLTSVTVAYKEADHKTRGFGILFAKTEGLNSLGVLLNNCIFDNRGPYWTETYMFDTKDLSDKSLLEKTKQDRKKLFNTDTNPEHYKVYVWPKAVPVYNHTIAQIMDEIELPEYVYLHGNYLGHIGLQKILNRSYLLAEELIGAE